MAEKAITKSEKNEIRKFQEGSEHGPPKRKNIDMVRSADQEGLYINQCKQLMEHNAQLKGKIRGYQTLATMYQTEKQQNLRLKVENSQLRNQLDVALSGTLPDLSNFNGTYTSVPLASPPQNKQPFGNERYFSAFDASNESRGKSENIDQYTTEESIQNNLVINQSMPPLESRGKTELNGQSDNDVALRHKDNSHNQATNDSELLDKDILVNLSASAISSADKLNGVDQSNFVNKSHDVYMSQLSDNENKTKAHENTGEYSNFTLVKTDDINVVEKVDHPTNLNNSLSTSTQEKEWSLVDKNSNKPSLNIADKTECENNSPQISPVSSSPSFVQLSNPSSKSDVQSEFSSIGLPNNEWKKTRVSTELKSFCSNFMSNLTDNVQPHFQSTMLAITEKVERLEKKITFNEIMLVDNRVKEEKMKREIESLQNMLQESKLSNATMRDQLDRYKNDASKNVNGNDLITLSKHQQSPECGFINKDANILEDKNDTKLIVVSDKEQQLLSQLNKRNNKINQMEEELQLMAENEAKQSKKHQQELAEVEADKNRLYQLLESLKKTKASLEAELKEERAMREELEQRLMAEEDKRRQSDIFRTQLSTTLHDDISTNDMLTGLSNVSDESLITLENSKTQLQLLRQQVTVFKEDFDQERRDREKAREEMEKYKAKWDQMKHYVIKLKEQLQKTQLNLSRSQKENRDLKDQIKKISKDFDDLKILVSGQSSRTSHELSYISPNRNRRRVDPREGPKLWHAPRPKNSNNFKPTSNTDPLSAPLRPIQSTRAPSFEGVDVRPSSARIIDYSSFRDDVFLHSSTGGGKSWKCAACTYLNKFDRTICDICQTPKVSFDMPWRTTSGAARYECDPYSPLRPRGSSDNGLDGYVSE